MSVEPVAVRPLPPAWQPLRVLVWLFHLALPLAGLWLLLARPAVDVTWHHAPSHFWLVLAVAGVNVVLGALMGAVARRRGDARLFLVSLVFLTSAGFFLLHALATPGVLIGHTNVGFDLAQPVGLALAAVLAVVSSLPLGRTPLPALAWLRTGLTVLLFGWALISLLDLPPLSAPPQARDVTGPLTAVAVAGVVLYLAAAVRFYRLHRRTPAAMLVSLVTAFALLAEAMAAVILAKKWQLSWWEWHLLLTFAFGFVAYSAYVQYRREGSSAGLFDAITLDQTARQIRAEYGAALEELVGALQEQERTGVNTSPATAARLADRFGLTEGQTAVLDRAGAALAAERALSRRLAALVAVGERARVEQAEDEFLREVLEKVRPAYGDVHIGLVSNGRLDAAVRDGYVALPLHVKGRLAGVVEAPRSAGPLGRTDDALLATLASQLSISLENARLYRELSTLFRQYLSPDVATALLADPDQAALGGSVVEVTALFADLRGFTGFSEGVEPAEIVRMLNRYHGVAVPCILDNGGTIVQFVGDALLALFNAPARQADHAARAVRAALALQRAVEAIAEREPHWPRFRVGANTGPALVGNIGSETLRGFNAMGDAVNVAARLQTLAEPGQVVIGEATRSALGAGVHCEPLGELTVKGRAQPVRAYVVTGLLL
ncbi:MAG: adenylate/guanylate cyclase domain-containing protein [Micromonosporaceae bacterium]